MINLCHALPLTGTDLFQSNKWRRAAWSTVVYRGGTRVRLAVEYVREFSGTISLTGHWGSEGQSLYLYSRPSLSLSFFLCCFLLIHLFLPYYAYPILISHCNSISMHCAGWAMVNNCVKTIFVKQQMITEKVELLILKWLYLINLINSMIISKKIDKLNWNLSWSYSETYESNF